MGLFDSIKTGLSNVKQTFTTIAANTLSTVGVKNTFVETNKSTFTSPIPLAAKVAEHPFMSAAVITSVVNPTATISTAKKALTSIASTVSKAFTASSLTTKAAVIVATPVVASTLATSSKARSSLVNTPKSLVTFGTNLGSVIDNPSISSVTKLAKDSPVITAATALAGVAAVGGGIGLAANTVATYVNSKATKSNTAATLGGVSDAITTSIGQVQSNVSGIDYKAEAKLLEAQTKSQIAIIEAQTKQAKEITALTQSQPIAAVPISTPNTGTVAKASPKKKKKKAKKKPKKKAKKKPKKKAKKKKKAKTIKKTKKKKKKR